MHFASGGTTSAPLESRPNQKAIDFFRRLRHNTSIDAATAMLVYKSKNMEELGRQLVIARAGATQVRIDVTKEGK